MRVYETVTTDREISIHALRVEGDAEMDHTRALAEISIHALRVEGDAIDSVKVKVLCNFYPRPPGGGRRWALSLGLSLTHFYPRPPGGGRPHLSGLCIIRHNISIHALRVEGDASISFSFSITLLFLSTPSGWRATSSSSSSSGRIDISIHALRVEGDSISLIWYFGLDFDFYPHPSGGGRQLEDRRKNLIDRISIHALRVEGDETAIRCA